MITHTPEGWRPLALRDERHWRGRPFLFAVTPDLDQLLRAPFAEELNAARREAIKLSGRLDVLNEQHKLLERRCEAYVKRPLWRRLWAALKAEPI